MGRLNLSKVELKAARVILGMKGHRPSEFNIKVGRCMKASGVTPSPGGRYSKRFQAQFIRCAIDAGAKVGAAGRAKAAA